MTGSTRTYLYALIRPATVHLALAGIEATPVRVVAHADDLGAVVSTVPADLFEPSTLEARLADLTWVEAVARAHDAVVSAAADVATAIPLRLGTTADDDAAVQGLLADLAAPARREFDRLHRRREYGVQVFGAPRRRAGAAGPGETGRSFLQRRRAELERDDADATTDAAQADEVVAALADEAVECRRNPPRQGPADLGSPMLVNAVFLVDDERADAFRARVEALATQLGTGRVVLTGPWAPYSFAELTV
jgi:hypothetical protein